MKIFAIQKTPANTYSQFSQNNSVNQNPVTKTNHAGDKFVSKISFGASINQLETELAKKEAQLEKLLPSTKAYQDLKDIVDRLKVKIEMATGGDGESYGGPAAHAANHPND